MSLDDLGYRLVTKVLEDHQNHIRRRTSNRGLLVEAALIVCVLGAFVAYVAPTLDRPLLEKHAFRQTQTAYTARIFHEQGIDLLHPKLPVLGEPFEVPFEFPLFQAAASVVMEAGAADDLAMRLTGLACFVMTALLLYGLVRHVADPISALAALVAFVMTPFSLVWGRASLIEYLATASAVGFAWTTILWRERGRPLPGALALVAGVVGMLVKPTTAVFWIAPALAYRPAETLGPAPRRWIRVWTAVLVFVPIAAVVLWTRHADAVKAASPTTAWLTSGALQDWNLGTLGQRFDTDTFTVIGKRLVPNVLGPSGVLLLIAAALATAGAIHRRFWIGIWFAALGPPLVFTNLYVAHDYYLAAVSPAFAALVGLGAGRVWSALRRSRSAQAVAVAVALILVYLTLELGRGYWLRIHGAEDDPSVLPLARQIDAYTVEGDLIGVAGLDWSPAVLYYAHRWGHMAVRATEEGIAYDLMHEQGYRYFLSADPEHGDLERLNRWRFVGALDRNLYALADRPTNLSGSLAIAFDDPSGLPKFIGSRPPETEGLRITCERPTSIRSGAQGTWMRFATGYEPRAQLTVSSELAPIPVRRFVYAAPQLASGGKLTLTCRGVPSLVVENIEDGPGPADS